MKKLLIEVFYAPLAFVRWAGRYVGNISAVLISAIAGVLILAAIAGLWWLAGYIILASFVGIFGLSVPMDFNHCMYALGVVWTLRWILSASGPTVRVDHDKKE